MLPFLLRRLILLSMLLTIDVPQDCFSALLSSLSTLRLISLTPMEELSYVQIMHIFVSRPCLPWELQIHMSTCLLTSTLKMSKEHIKFNKFKTELFP